MLAVSIVTTNMMITIYAPHVASRAAIDRSAIDACMDLYSSDPTRIIQTYDVPIATEVTLE
jgi:hypothetical protein